MINAAWMAVSSVTCSPTHLDRRNLVSGSDLLRCRHLLTLLDSGDFESKVKDSGLVRKTFKVLLMNLIKSIVPLQPITSSGRKSSKGLIGYNSFTLRSCWPMSTAMYWLKSSFTKVVKLASSAITLCAVTMSSQNVACSTTRAFTSGGDSPSRAGNSVLRASSSAVFQVSFDEARMVSMKTSAFGLNFR